MIIFFIFLKFFTTLSVQFHSDFFRNSCLLQLVVSESVGKEIAIYRIAPRNDFSSSFDIGGFNCKIASIFTFRFYSMFGSFVFQPSCFFEEKFGLFLTCSVSGFLKFLEYYENFPSMFFFVHLVTTIISSIHMGVW